MASKATNLFTAKAATGAGSSVKVAVPTGVQNIPYVVRGTFVGTVVLEGSVDGTNWVAINGASKTAPSADTVPAFPWMRANVTAYTSGSITVDLWADTRFG